MERFERRRAQLYASMASAHPTGGAGGSPIPSVMLLPAAATFIRNNDVEHAYRQDSDVFYTSGFTEPDSVVLLTTAHPDHRFVLFVRPRDPEREQWDGDRAGVEGATADLGADAAFPIDELAAQLPQYLTGAERLYYRLGRDREMDDRVLAAIAASRGRGRTPEPWPTAIVDPSTLLHEMRLFKDAAEIDAMRRAVAITAEAHVAAMKLAAPGRYEYEIEARMLEIFRQRGSERVAYFPIVGSGKNATVLHYRSNSRKMKDGELLLIDAGCELDYYASDVTRTFPVSGRFSEAQRKIYEIVLEAQQAAIEAVRPGATIDGVHDLTVETLVRGLCRIGLMTGEVPAIIEDQSYRKYFMHRTSHWLGMDVHDVGAYYADRAPRPFAAGMVLTVEPGLYFPEGDESVPAEYRGIGVRIEDDVLVTEDGRESLSDSIPKTVADVERACRG
jgi:Xaa-Pro aminopeptidase